MVKLQPSWPKKAQEEHKGPNFLFRGVNPELTRMHENSLLRFLGLLALQSLAVLAPDYFDDFLRHGKQAAVVTAAGVIPIIFEQSDRILPLSRVAIA